MGKIIDMPVNVAAFSPERKLEFITEQIMSVKRGDASSMFCPYCGTRNRPSDQYLCCQLFADSTSAIIDRMENQDAVEFFQNVAERAGVN